MFLVVVDMREGTASSVSGTPVASDYALRGPDFEKV